jgi:hypothetical protein
MDPTALFPSGARDLRVWGTLSIAIWLAAFAFGALVPSCPSRRALDWRLSDDCSGRSEVAQVDGARGRPANSFVTVAAAGSAAGGAIRASSAREAATDAPASAASEGEKDPSTSVGPFLLGAITYTPSNLALLALASGFIAGCSSRLLWAAKHGDAAAGSGAKGEDVGDTSYLRESPFASMFRSFAAYLVALGGLLVISPEMFMKTSPEMYMRMAGLVSALAFAVGYDPSRLSAVLAPLFPPTPPPERPTSGKAT